MRVPGKIQVCLAISFLMLSAIPMSLGEESADGLPEWTFIVYLDADNNLEHEGIVDLNEMEIVGSTDDVNIVVQMDRCAVEGYDESNGDWTGAKRFYVTKDPDMDIINSDEIEDLGEVNMGHPQTLVNFTTWVIDNYPAKKYALVLWDHGGAFWSVCWDEDNEEDCLTMPELKCALENIEDHLGRDLDLIGFDACLMAQVAVMYQIRNSVDIGVGSGYVEPGAGWPYDKILPRLVDEPQMSAKELGTIIADEYVNSYTDKQGTPDDTVAITMAVFDLEKFDELAYEIDKLSMILSIKAGTSLEGGHYRQLEIARTRTSSYDLMSGISPIPSPIDPTGYCMYDVIDLMDNIRSVILFDDDIRDAAQTVKFTTNEVILHFAVNTWHGNVEGANGLSIYFPSGIEFDTQYDERYDEVDFAIDTYWDGFLHHYHNKENAQDTPPCVFITNPRYDDEIDRSQTNNLIINGTAFDAQNELSLVEINIDGGDWIQVGASAKWYHDLSLSGLDNGEHIIYARSFDGDDYSAEDSVKIFIVGEAIQEEGSSFSPILIAILAVIVVLAGLFILKKRKRA